jgi:hypothetical protein
VLIVAGSVWFYSLATYPSGVKRVGQDAVVMFSVATLATSILVSIWCLILAELASAERRPFGLEG